MVIIRDSDLNSSYFSEAYTNQYHTDVVNSNDVNLECKEKGLEHAWRDCTGNVVLDCYPPIKPTPQEKCANCGLIRSYGVKKIVDYDRSDSKDKGELS